MAATHRKKACTEGQEGVASAPSNRKADRSNIKASASDRMNTGVHKKKNNPGFSKVDLKSYDTRNK